MLGQIQLRKEIADRLTNARTKAGFETPEEFCQKYNIDPKKYIKHEKGQISLRASQAILYCESLQITLHWLMLGEEFGGRQSTSSVEQQFERF